MTTQLIKNLPAELQEKIYSYDDTYKPSPDNEIWFSIQIRLIGEVEDYWERRYPNDANKFLDYYDDDTDDDTDDESDEESDEEEDGVLLTLDQYYLL